MKKAAVFTMCLLALLFLCSCKAKEQNQMEPASNQTVTIINDIHEADIWILPQTKQNLKTTAWGQASAAKVKPGESREVPLCEPGDDGLYLLRMIDTDSFYYSANAISLKNGYRLQIKGEHLQNITATVIDNSGSVVNTYAMFAAKL